MRPTSRWCFLLILFCGHGYGDTTTFDQCLPDLGRQALDHGISQKTVDAVIPGLEYQSRVIELDRSQPEFTQTFGDYFSKRVSKTRIERGQALYSEMASYLAQLTAQYGVPGQYLVAFWGLETNYGGYLGNMPTLDSLATLACDERRSEFFTGEFLLALELMEREDIGAKTMKGSWAGAVGHTQFMPSNYLRYAVDGDKDGTIDLWNSRRDALASAANFLEQLGWVSEERWGREVRLPEHFDYSRSEGKHNLGEWRKLGLQQADGLALPVVADMEARLLLPAGHRGPAFLAYTNFDVIMRWNRSTSYALSVGHLADRIAGAGSLRQAFPKDQPRLHRDDVVQMQQLLQARGFDAGEPDGVVGPATRLALRGFQREQGVPVDGFPDRETLRLLGVDGY